MLSATSPSALTSPSTDCDKTRTGREVRSKPARAEEKYLDKRASTPTRNAGTPKGRVSTYRKRWPKAFPLWSPTKESLGLLWQSAFDARQNAERRLTQGLVCQDQQQQGDDGDEGE
jgi:hypothetical protein